MTLSKERVHLRDPYTSPLHTYTVDVDENRVSTLAVPLGIWLSCAYEALVVSNLREKSWHSPHLHGWHACRTRLAGRVDVWFIPFTSSSKILGHELAINASILVYLSLCARFCRSWRQ